MSNAYQNVSWPGWETQRSLGQGSFGNIFEIQRNIQGNHEKATLHLLSLPLNAGEIDALRKQGYDNTAISGIYQEQLQRIVAEYTMLQKVNSGMNIVNCDEVRYMAYEDGLGLDVFMKTEPVIPLAQALPYQIPEELVVKLAMDICAGLIFCKGNGISQRDINPHTIYMSENGTFKLGDFGIPRILEGTTANAARHTHLYMAPEVYVNQPYGDNSEVYSLGMVLYWLLNERRLPFLPMSPQPVTASMEDAAKNRRYSGEQIPAPTYGSDGLKYIVLKACAYDPMSRYATAEAMYDDIYALSAGLPLPSASPAAFHPPVAETPPVYPGPTPVPPVPEPPAPTPVKKGSKKPLILVLALCAVIAVCVAVLFLTKVICFHSWEDPTCANPKTCVHCQQTEGTALGHSWENATCSDPKTCTVCGKEEGKALDHDWLGATCYAPDTCSICGSTKGEALEHEWKEATCLDPITCIHCGETTGKALGHTWVDATYDNPKMCVTCGSTKGEALVRDGWFADDDGNIYYYENGYAPNGWYTVIDVTYYFRDGMVVRNESVMIGTVLHTFNDKGVLIQCTYEELEGTWSDDQYHFSDGATCSYKLFSTPITNCTSADFCLYGEGNEWVSENGTWYIYVRINGTWTYLTSLAYSEDNTSTTVTWSTPATFDGIMARLMKNGNYSYSYNIWLENVQCAF